MYKSTQQHSIKIKAHTVHFQNYLNYKITAAWPRFHLQSATHTLFFVSRLAKLHL